MTIMSHLSDVGFGTGGMLAGAVVEKERAEGTVDEASKEA